MGKVIPLLTKIVVVTVWESEVNIITGMIEAGGERVKIWII